MEIKIKRYTIFNQRKSIYRLDLKYWILYESIYYFDRVWSAEKEICNGWGVQLIILNIEINFIGPKVYMRYAFFFIVSIPLLIGFMKKEREKR